MNTESLETATPMKPKVAKKSPAKKSDAKAALAAGAAELRKAQAEAKKKVSSKTLPTKDAGKLEVIPKIIEAKGDVNEIMAKCVVMSPDNGSLKLDKDTTTGEYVRIFDNVVGLSENVQFLIGDLINQGAELKSFDGKYAAAMASTGRSIDALKAYASAARHTPPAWRKLAPYTHCREVIKIEDKEAAKAILVEYAESEKKGKPLTVKQVRAKAAPLAQRQPKKPRVKKTTDAPKPPLIMSELERDHLRDMESVADRLVTLIGSAAYALDISTEESLTLREKLDTIARFAAQLRPVSTK